jgi:hypothetical protein
VYAYLAGVIVELVSRSGERVREIDNIFNALVDYVEAINFPVKKRQRFYRFFWHAQPYLKTNVLESKLPNLSEKLTGELLRFNHGNQLEHVAIFCCDDLAEQQRFHVAMATKIMTKLYDCDESVLIDGLLVVLEGILLFDAKVKVKGACLGIVEFVDGVVLGKALRNATSMTFVACSYSSPEHLQAVLQTRRYPNIAKQMHSICVRHKFQRAIHYFIAMNTW